MLRLRDTAGTKGLFKQEDSVTRGLETIFKLNSLENRASNSNVTNPDELILGN